MKKASFKKRLLAYLIDVFVVGLIISIISYNFNTTRIDRLNKEAYNLMNKYVNKEISTDKYISNYASITYDMASESVVSTTLYLVVCIGYFLIFQYLNDGQSIGKKLVGVKIVSNDKKRVSFLQMFIRTSIVNDIVNNIMILILVNMTSNMNFFIGYGLINVLCNIFVIICVFMIILRKDKLALNDMMSKSLVIEVR